MQQPPNNDPWQQPQEGYNQPPNQPYPQQQQPVYPPPLMSPPPKKKRGPLFWVLIIGGALLICVACSGIGTAISHTSTTVQDTPTSAAIIAPTATSAPTQAGPTGTPAPTPKPPKWTPTHTFSGNGSKKTAVFSVPDDWKVVWSCNPSSFDGLDYNVIITVYNSDGTVADSGVNSTCTKTNTHDETEIHTSGNVYLDIVSEGNWKIQIQEFK